MSAVAGGIVWPCGFAFQGCFILNPLYQHKGRPMIEDTQMVGGND
jgi:hypothetical protein